MNKMSFINSESLGITGNRPSDEIGKALGESFNFLSPLVQHSNVPDSVDKLQYTVFMCLILLRGVFGEEVVREWLISTTKDEYQPTFDWNQLIDRDEIEPENNS